MYLNRYVSNSSSASKSGSHAVAISILLSPALLIIDHVHFQYNGFLYGILILSLVLARQESTRLLGGFLFVALLCLKHIYLYLVPAYFVYLLRAYCLGQKSILRIRFGNSLRLAFGLAGIFGAAFGPFLYWGQLDQLLARLFPFSRGLCHAYWAPNVWAMYSFTDRVLIYSLCLYNRCGRALLMKVSRAKLRGKCRPSFHQQLNTGSGWRHVFCCSPEYLTKGHIYIDCHISNGSFAFRQSMCLTNISKPSLVKLFWQPSWDNFVGAVTLCGYASFLFGWHVHEKAILLVIIPFSLVALKNRRYLGAFRPLAVAGHVSLFPLLFTAAEFPVKTVYTVFWLILFLLVFDRLAPVSSHPRVFLLDRFSLLYIAISVPLILYCSLLHQLVFGPRYGFLPLMFTSSYSAVGVVGSWIGFLVVYFTS